MFPNGTEGLMVDEESATLTEAFTSENIHERLPGLRGILARIIARVADRYGERRKAYAGNLQDALASLEAMPEWSQIQPEDREDIARQFAIGDLPETAPSGRELSLLRMILAREVGLPQLRIGAEAEVHRRVPRPSPSGVEPPVTEEESVDLAEFVPADALKTAADVESWLGQIRGRILALIRANKHVRISRGPLK
jgi:hypothetical protein